MKSGLFYRVFSKLSPWILGVFCAFCLSFPSFAADSPDKLSDSDINQFLHVLQVIKSHYAKTISDQKLLEDAERGMVSNLDPHSEYLDETAYNSLLSQTNGSFGGLGIELIDSYGVLKVVTPVDGTPAAKAGIKSGDYIVALDDKLVNTMTSDEAVEMMRGKEGTPIKVTIIRAGETHPLVFNLIRAIIRTDAVQSKMLEAGYGYVHIDQFQHETNDLLVKAINDLKQQSHGQLKGLIIDLRNNPGGLLDTAIQVVNTFLDSDKLKQYNKLIVYTEGRSPDAKFEGVATGHDILHGAPLIILINEGSASASEIVAGALQDYHRAVIVGETSFGKGSVQTILPLDKTHAVKITTALYHTPSGRIIQDQGIIPDVTVSALKVDAVTNSTDMDPVREFQLKDHLINQAALLPSDDTTKPMHLAADDFQLYESLHILKTMTLLNTAH